MTALLLLLFFFHRISIISNMSIEQQAVSTIFSRYFKVCVMFTWCVLSGSLQMTSSADLMLEHVASYLKKDPVDIKLANLYKIGQTDINQIHLTFDFGQIYRSKQ